MKYCKEMKFRELSKLADNLISGISGCIGEIKCPVGHLLNNLNEFNKYLKGEKGKVEVKPNMGDKSNG